MATKKATPRKSTSKAKKSAFGFQTVTSTSKGAKVSKKFVRKAGSPIGMPLKNAEDSRLAKEAMRIIREAPRETVMVNGKKITRLQGIGLRASAKQVMSRLPDLQKTDTRTQRNESATLILRGFVQNYGK